MRNIGSELRVLYLELMDSPGELLLLLSMLDQVQCQWSGSAAPPGLVGLRPRNLDLEW